jgi:hypothetical protein
MQLRIIFAIVFSGFLFMVPVMAETSFSDTFNYQSINRSALLVPEKPTLKAQNAYAVSSLLLSVYLSSTANSYNTLLTDSTQSDVPLQDKVYRNYITSPVTGDTLFIVDLRIYSPELVGRRYCRMILIRPYDNVERPCILYTHGSSGNLQSWVTYFYLGIPDMLQRGYAVAVYENWNSFQHISLLNGGDSIYKDWDYKFFGDSAIVVSDDNAIQRGHYLLYQYATAAADYLEYIAPNYHIDIQKVYAAGHSAGGLSAMMLTFADEQNFNHPIFLEVGAHRVKSYQNLEKRSFEMKGVLSSGAGLHDPDISGTHTGKYIGDEDNEKVVMMIHGKNDPAADVSYGRGLWGDFVDTVKLMGPLTLHPVMNTFGIKNFSIINCIGEHGVFSYPFTVRDGGGRLQFVNAQAIPYTTLTDADFVTDTSLLQLTLYGHQILMMLQATAELFSFKMQDRIITTPSAVYSWTTGNYLRPIRNDIPDWFFVPAECSIPDALPTYFNLETATKASVISQKYFVKTYPQPANDQVQLSVGMAMENMSLSVFDLTGKQMLLLSQTGNQMSFSVSEWPSGIYVYRLHNQQGTLISAGKMMVLH